MTTDIEEELACRLLEYAGYSVTTSADIRLSFDAKEYDDDGNLLEDAPEIDGDAVKEYLYGEILD